MGALTSRREAHRNLTAAGPDGEEPVIQLYSSVAAEVSGIADLLRRAHLIDGIPWSRMAVLVRSGVRSIPIVRRALVAAGVPVSVAADDLPLSRDPAVAPLLRALEVIEDRSRPADKQRGLLTPDAARTMLMSPLGNATPAQLRALGRRLRELDRAASEDGLARPSDQLIHDSVNDPRDLIAVPDWVAAPVVRLTRLLSAAQQVAADGGSPAEVLWALWDGSGWGHRLAANCLILEGLNVVRPWHRTGTDVGVVVEEGTSPIASFICRRRSAGRPFSRKGLIRLAISLLIFIYYNV